MAELQARWHRAIAELPQEAWDTLLGDHAAAPFYRWRWLHRLEASGSIVPREGWQPCHLGLWRGGELVAAAPLYLKGHSYGEFVFDQSFAQLAGQLGHQIHQRLHAEIEVEPQPRRDRQAGIAHQYQPIAELAGGARGAPLQIEGSADVEAQHLAGVLQPHALGLGETGHGGADLELLQLQLLLQLLHMRLDSGYPTVCGCIQVQIKQQ